MANIDLTKSGDKNKQTNLTGHSGVVQGAHVTTIRPYNEQNVKDAARAKFNEEYNNGHSQAPGIWGFIQQAFTELGKLLAGGIQAVGSFFTEIFKGVAVAVEKFVNDIGVAFSQIGLDPSDTNRFPQITQAAGQVFEAQGKKINEVNEQANKALERAEKAIEQSESLDASMDEKILKLVGNSQEVKNLISQIGDVSKSLKEAERGLGAKIAEGVDKNAKIATLVAENEGLVKKLDGYTAELEKRNREDSEKIAQLTADIAKAQTRAETAITKAGEGTAHADSLIQKVRETQGTPSSAIPVLFGTSDPAFTSVGRADTSNTPTGFTTSWVFTGAKTVADKTVAPVNPRCEYEVSVWVRASKTTTVTLGLVGRDGVDAVEQTYTTTKDGNGVETVATYATTGLIPGGTVQAGGWEHYAFRLKFKPTVFAVRVPSVSVGAGEVRLAGVTVTPYAPSTMDILEVQNQAITANTKATTANTNALKAQAQFNALMAGKWDSQSTFNDYMRKAVDSYHMFETMQRGYNETNNTNWSKQSVVNNLVNDVNSSVKGLAVAQKNQADLQAQLWAEQQEKNRLQNIINEQNNKTDALTRQLIALEAMKNSASLYCPLYNGRGLMDPSWLYRCTHDGRKRTDSLFPFTQHRGTMRGVSYLEFADKTRSGMVYIDEPGEWKIEAHLSFGGRVVPYLVYAWNIVARAANTWEIIDIRTFIQGSEHGKFNGGVSMRLNVPNSWFDGEHYAIISVELESADSRYLYVGSRYTALELQQVSRDYHYTSPNQMLNNVGYLMTEGARS